MIIKSNPLIQLKNALKLRFFFFFFFKKPFGQIILFLIDLLDLLLVCITLRYPVSLSCVSQPTYFIEAQCYILLANV